MEESWGLSCSVDVINCDLAIIKSPAEIQRYVIELCKLIDMKRYGDCQIVHFGADEKVAGYSMVQLIETSLISGHFANLSRRAFIDVFSCKDFDTNAVAEFTLDFFKGDGYSANCQIRG
jgi:S-adenosylmethionine decarboxylase